MSDHSHTTHHGSEARVYGLTLIALFVLTGITVGAASINFGSSTVNVVIALGIATFKATLVALIFMHLRHDRPINAVIFTSSLFFLSVFLGFCLIDAGSREHVVPSNKEPMQMAPPTAAAAPQGAEGHGAAAPAAVPAAEHH